MKKLLLLLLIILFETSCFANAYVYLNSITYDGKALQTAGKIPLNVTIKSSDQLGWANLKNKPNEYPNIQNVVFNVEDLSAFSFTVPFAGWDGDATIQVKVFKGNELISEMQLQDRNRVMKFIGIKNAESKDIPKTRRARIYQSNSSYTDKDIDCSFDVSLNVEPDTGRLMIGGVRLIDCDDADQVDRITQ